MQLLVAVVLLLVMARRWRNAPVFSGWAAAPGVTHWRSSASARAVSWRLLALLVVLAAFSVGVGVGVDMVHAALLGLSIDLPLSTLEAGGEVGAMSALLAYVFHLARTQ